MATTLGQRVSPVTKIATMTPMNTPITPTPTSVIAPQVGTILPKKNIMRIAMALPM